MSQNPLSPRSTHRPKIESALERAAEGAPSETLTEPCTFRGRSRTDGKDTEREIQAVRINVTFKKGVLEQIDSYTKQRRMTRAGFLEEAALEKLAKR